MLTAENFLAFLEGQPFDEEQYEEIEAFLEKVPYAGLLHLLAARYQAKRQSHLTPLKIRRTALHIYSRKQLALTLQTLALEQNNSYQTTSYDRMKEKSSKVHRVLEDIQKEITSFDETLATASPEELDRELQKNYTHSKDYFSSLEENSSNAESSMIEQSPQQTEEKQSAKSEPLFFDIPLKKEEISETKAIALYSEGKVREAIAVYEALKDKYPERKAYYQSQIDILREDLGESSPTPYTEPSAVSSQKPKSLVDTLHEIPKTFYTELDAIRMRDEGKDEEAIKIYERLILQHPEKKAYFERQIQIIRGL